MAFEIDRTGNCIEVLLWNEPTEYLTTSQKKTLERSSKELVVYLDLFNDVLAERIQAGGDLQPDELKEIEEVMKEHEKQKEEAKEAWAEAKARAIDDWMCKHVAYSISQSLQYAGYVQKRILA